jgi:hypothetical protein
VFPEDDEIFDSDNVGLLLMVYFFYMAEYFDFDKSLLGVFGITFDDLESNLFFVLVIEDFEDLSVGSFSDER